MFLSMHQSVKYQKQSFFPCLEKYYNTNYYNNSSVQLCISKLLQEECYSILYKGLFCNLLI